MSHYPSTAELAAFRRAVPRHGTPFPSAPVHRNSNDGAYSWQRTKGIGLRDRDIIPCGVFHLGGRVPCAVEVGDRSSFLRRCAGALRSRAYAAAACPVCGVANIPDGPGCDCYGS